jgi:integrase
VRLPGAWGSAEFQEAYKAAIAGETAPKVEIGASQTKAGSVSAAIVTYLNSIDFGNLALGTQRNWRFILDRFRERFGHLPLKGLTGRRIEEILAEKVATHAARNFLKALKPVIAVAMRAGLIDADPTIGIRRPKARDTGGYQTWTDEHIAQFESFHAIGTKARLAFALLLYTGQRRGDIIRMGPQHIRNGFIHVRQAKTGATLAIPMHPELQKVLDAHPIKRADFLTTFMTTKSGKPYLAGSFTQWFKRKCEEAGLPAGLSAHGLRKAMCRRLAEAGCSANEIAAISGHATLHEVARYTKAADQKRMVESAMASIEQKATRNWKTTTSDWKTKSQVIEKK